MHDTKTILSIIAVALTFVGYVPYVRDTIKGKTKPHIFSWLLWSVTTAIIYFLQIKAGAGVGAWATLSVVFMTLFVFILGLKNGDKDVKKIDIIFFISALGGLVIWLVIKQPILSIILLTGVDILGFAPTFRKSWDHPYSETLFMYCITVLRHSIGIFALREFNLITALFPVSWVIVNALFVVTLIIRRRKKSA